jgi:hypothetical protein
MTFPSSRVRLVVAAVAAAALVIVFVTVREAPPRKIIIETSSTFDVTNLRHLAGYADNVFVGEVRAIVGVEDDHTQYQVTVEDTVKGQLEGEVIVSQLGYVTGNETHVTEDQPLLVMGESYLLVTNPNTSGKDWQDLISGPMTAIPIRSGSRAATIERYRDAVANQMYPPGLPPKP